MSVTSVLRALLAAVLIGCVVVPAGASASARHNRTEAAIIREMNQVRASYNLPRLHTSRGLARAADAHSKSMARRGVISHGAYSERVRRYVRTKSVGENVAWMSRCSATAVVQMWLNSANHRRVMLRRGFRRIGVGSRSPSGACFVTADFASAH